MSVAYGNGKDDGRADSRLGEACAICEEPVTYPFMFYDPGMVLCFECCSWNSRGLIRDIKELGTEAIREKSGQAYNRTHRA